MLICVKGIEALSPSLYNASAQRGTALDIKDTSTGCVSFLRRPFNEDSTTLEKIPTVQREALLRALKYSALHCTTRLHNAEQPSTFSTRRSAASLVLRRRFYEDSTTLEKIPTVQREALLRALKHSALHCTTRLHNAEQPSTLSTRRSAASLVLRRPFYEDSITLETIPTVQREALLRTLRHSALHYTTRLHNAEQPWNSPRHSVHVRRLRLLF